MTPYEKVFERFLQKIEDKDLPRMSESDRNDMLIGWLDSALSFMELDDVSYAEEKYADRNDTIGVFNNDLSHKDIELIALYMVVAWYEPRVNSLEHTLSFVGSKDDNYKSSETHMKTIHEIQSNYREIAQSYWNNYRIKHNSYLDEK